MSNGIEMHQRVVMAPTAEAARQTTAEAAKQQQHKQTTAEATA